MSNLTVDTLTNQDVQLAKAWVNFNGSGTVAIRSAFNVSSITDDGRGSYPVNFTSAMGDAGYSIGGMSAREGASVASGIGINGTPTTTTLPIVAYAAGTTSNAIADRVIVSINIFSN